MRKIIKKTLSVFIAVVMISSLLPVVSFAADTITPYTSFAYSTSGSTITLGKYNGSSTTVVVPGSYTINGTTYTTSINSDAAFKSNTKITSVTLQKGVKFKSNTMQNLFYGCTALTTVDLSEISTTGVTSMQAAFYNCSKLTTLDLSSFDTSKVTTMRSMFNNCSKLTTLDLSSFDTSSVTTMQSMFNNCSSLTALDLSNFNTSKVTTFETMFNYAGNLTLTGYENLNTSSLTNLYYTFNHALTNQVLDLSKWDLSKVTTTLGCFQYSNITDIRLPDSLPIISAFALNHVTGYSQTSFTIPAGVKEIGYAHALYDFGATNNFKEFKVAEGNTNFKAVDGVLYSMDGTKLIAVPRAKTFPNKTFEIPEGVTFMGELSFSRNYNTTTLVLPNSYKIRQYVSLYDPEYCIETNYDEGNINSGNSLSIAVYILTSIANYEVKPDNPNYSSKEGIIYSKDMTSVIAIPTHYNKHMNIPEGVSRWEAYAIMPPYADDPCKSTGVNIPASMTYIAPEQIKTINNFKKSYDYIITVNENNPVYKVDANGYLVQYGISEYDISLSESSYIYDGTAKMPTVTVTAASGTTTVTSKTLTSGTNYTVEYIDNVEPGIAKVKVTGKGSYSGVAYKTFVITSENSEDNFESYTRNADTASTSLPKAAGTNFLKVNGVADTTWKAASTGFGSSNSAHAGIIKKANGTTTDNVLAIESVGGSKNVSQAVLGSYSNWDNKSRVIYNDITFNNTDRYTVKVDFYRGSSTAGGGLIFNYDGSDSSSLSSSNYYALDFVGKAYSYGARNFDGDIYATALVKNGNIVSDATIKTNYSGSDYTQTIESLSRNGHDYIASTTWHTLTLTYYNGTIEWSVYRINEDTVVQTGRWTDPSPSTSDSMRIALFSGGADNSYMHFDNLRVEITSPQQPKYSESANNITVEFSPEAIDDIEEIEKLHLIVAHYDSETDDLVRMEKKEITNFNKYQINSYTSAADGEYTKIFIWKGNFIDMIPSYRSITVE